MNISSHLHTLSSRFAVQEYPAPGTYRAIFEALDACSRDIIGPGQPRILAIPLYGEAGDVAGGLWGYTQFQWLYVHFLVVPEPRRNRGVGSALVALAEGEAQQRGCIGSQVTTLSFQAASFYRKLDYVAFAELKDLPPGHSTIFLSKRLDVPAGPCPA
jgi:GNAT superfamily N-acetyltransferase